MVGTARDVFLIAAADVFICSFNDNDANKQSQIKINFVATPLWSVVSLARRIHLRRVSVLR
jgi:hypothetical protein